MKTKRRNKKGKLLKTILIWTLISLSLQFGFYALLNQQVNKVLHPTISDTPAQTLEATIPGTGFANIHLSYEKDYLAYTENGALKIFNLKLKKVVFEKAPPEGVDKLGVLAYEWLPDRNTLIYFYAKKNPNPTTTITTPVQPATQTPVDQEDPNQPAKPSTPQSTTKTIYHNPELVDLYTLEMPDSDQSDLLPDDRFNQTLPESFPEGGTIKDIVVSTFTNLLYLTVETDNAMQLLEIDVMKSMTSLHKKGETINTMTASDHYGTLYVESQIGKNRQILALWGLERQVVDKEASSIILGNRAGKLYLGKVENNQLVEIKQAEENDGHEDLSFSSIWSGKIPLGSAQVLIGERGQVIIYNQTMAYIVTNGELKEIPLNGDEIYISPDGLQLVELRFNADSTAVKLLPLESK